MKYRIIIAVEDPQEHLPPYRELKHIFISRHGMSLEKLWDKIYAAASMHINKSGYDASKYVEPCYSVCHDIINLTYNLKNSDL